jgi:hypothetical protein
MGEPAVETLETLETSLDTPQDTVDTTEVVEAAPAPARASEDATEDATEDAPTEPAPKKKGGRPVGAKSKAQGKPRPKRVAANKMRARALEEASPMAPPPPVEEEAAQLPRALAGSRPIPLESEINPRDRTSLMMMTMLREQATERRQRKADLWKSWFL